jgi:AraC family transcriptional regulator of adaptative response/methylated-DNA-[protein]-cysteine methyltransferase
MQENIVDYHVLSEDYYRIEKAIHYLEANYKDQPSLEDAARHIHMSEFHFQRLFRRWVGISPKRFVQYLTKEYAKQLMEEGKQLLDITYRSGLSSPGRLHDLFITCEAVTPGEYKHAGEGLTIHYGQHPSPFGECFLAITERGICRMAFVNRDQPEDILDAFKKRWNGAEFIEDMAKTEAVLREIFPLSVGERTSPLPLYLRGTNFQIKVWEALLQIPAGYVVSYEDIAVQIGMPGSTRAVSNAVARNPIPIIIPCHRVIRKNGAFGGYRWGTARKKAILGREFARRDGQLLPV